VTVGHGAAPLRRRAERFGVVLVLLVVTLFVGALLPARVAALVLAVLGVALWLAVARAAGLGRTARRSGLVAVCLVVGVAILAYAFASPNLRASADLLLAALAAALAVVIGRSLLRERVVTLSSVAAVLSVYLLIGLFFAQAYLGLHDLDTGAFLVPDETFERFDLIYFSYVALTTVGFGDIVPTTDGTRALAATEAVLGQLFLVTVVARVVSMIGQRRPG